VKKTELKKVLKPLIKDCIKEVIFEDGVLAGIISEVVQGLSKEVIVEQRAHSAQQNTPVKPAPAVRQRLTETKKKMLAAMGTDAYGGVDLFEGTQPMSTTGQESIGSHASPLAGRDPEDAGIDISGIMAIGNASKWGTLATGGKSG
jgi:hypothetical protein